MGATVHAVGRLYTRPDRHVLNGSVPGASCGRAYGQSMNAAVELSCFPEWQDRPSAAEVVRMVIYSAKANGMPTGIARGQPARSRHVHWR